MSSVSDSPVFVLNVGGEPPPITQNETSWITKFYRFPVIAAIMYLKCMWTHYFWPGTLGEEVFVPPGSVPDNPEVTLNINGEEMPAETNYYQSSFATNVHRFLVRTVELVCRLWTQYFPRGTSAEEGLVPPGSVPDNPGSALYFVIVGLFSFIAIKSQGETRFPFHSNPQTVTLAITCLILYGLVSEAEYVIAACHGPNSVYVVIARLGRKLCLYVLMGAMASLFDHSLILK
ncbi:hypothetical protein R6Q59_000042 [Mikania micrantha]|uniref:Uncharacterized protein n=1 Tax=Mikania micrantha TaxID=192012 RepID=A0A5N6PF66_9ASTR|nr:hypothetical protein E3N88_08019 [Mikania micrantha]